MCAELATHAARPSLMPLSPTSPSGEEGASELSAADAYAWTQGRALFADTHTDCEVATPGGGLQRPRKVQTTYVFPGKRVWGVGCVGVMACVPR